jgi:hypothetical protein
VETIRIGEKYYDVSKLTEQATSLLQDLQKVEGELGRLALSTSITNVAKNALIERLVAETANLVEVEAPETQAE